MQRNVSIRTPRSASQSIDVAHDPLIASGGPEQRRRLGYMLGAVAAGSLALIGALKGPEVPAEPANPLKERIGSEVDFRGIPLQDTISEAVERAAEGDHDADGTPNADDPDVELFSLDDVIALHGGVGVDPGEGVTVGEILNDTEPDED